MSALRIGTATYVGLLAFVAVKANDVVFPAPSSDDGPIVKGARAITARAADGHPVHALVFDPPDSRAPVVVQFHGNGEVVGWNQPLGLELKRRGFGAVLVEYRGYGKSTGVRPSEDGLYADAEAVIQWLRAAGVGPGRTALWGFRWEPVLPPRWPPAARAARSSFRRPSRRSLTSPAGSRGSYRCGRWCVSASTR